MTETRFAPGAGRAADAAALAHLAAVTVRFSNAYEYSFQGRERVAALYTADRLRPALVRGEVSVVRDEKGAAGFVAISRAANTGGPAELSVDALFVHPDAQGRGLGAALLEYGLDLAARGGEARVTVASSLTAEGFYARLGFERLSDVPRDYGLAVLMSRS